MARQINKLSTAAIRNAKKKGLYADGGNLYLQVTESGSQSWIFRYMFRGKPKSMGLGPLKTFRAPEARAKAEEHRKALKNGDDPLVQRKAQQAAAALADAHALTFKKCAETYIESHKAGWRNEKHIWQWTNSLEKFVYPTVGKVSVQDVDVGLVLKILEPIWQTKTETATRVRGRIEKILDWATARGYRQGENPARWRGHMQNLLPSLKTLLKIEHYKSLPYQEIAAFMKSIEPLPDLAPKALRLLILTATRTNETLKARWDEIDLKAAIWTIPGERMKMGKEHRIPLSKPALALLRDLYKHKKGDLVFPGKKAGKPLSNMALLQCLRRMNRKDIVVHGFRSTFRNWAAEQTNHSREAAETALAHKIADKTEASYLRGDFLEKRALLMEDWAKYCATKPKEKIKKAARA